MLDIIQNNPYRILGIYSNSPTKERVANHNRLKAFLKVGKDVSFGLDLPNYLPPVNRNECLVTAAQSAIELPIDQLKHTLFWFMKATPLDDIAFNHLYSGNISQAKEIWSKKESVSSLLNLMVCAMIEQDDTALALNADNLFQNHSTELCSSVNETLKLTSEQLIELFVELLNAEEQIDLAKLARIPGTSMTWQKAFGASLVKPLIDKITSAITEAKSAKGATANYSAGVKLMNSTRSELHQLKSLVGISDMQYQVIADKLAQTILQCGINYFNDSDNDDAPQKAMTLQKYALSIAVGQLAKDRCKENVDVLASVIKNLPPQEVKVVANEIIKEIEKLTNPKSSIVAVNDTINHIKQPIKSIYNNTNTAVLNYRKVLSKKIAIVFINTIEKAISDTIRNEYIDKEAKQSILRIQLEQARDAINWLNKLEFPNEFQEQYANKISEFKKIGQIFGLNPQYWEDKGSCYIATMAYGDYDHPQVVILRDFRDSYLAKRNWGRRFIKYYYAHSPILVEKLKNHKTINNIIRRILDGCVIIWKNIRSHE